MTNFNCNLQIISSYELQKYSRHFVNEFLREVEIYPPIVIDISFYPSHAAYQTEIKMSHLGPVYSERQDNCLTIHVCEEALMGIPLLALKGWLDQELTCCLLKLQPEFYQFNFNKQILPLVPVSGSAVNLLRHMVEHLKYGLNRFINGFLDLLTVTFINKYTKKPLHFFGSIGLVFFAFSMAINLYFTALWCLGSHIYIRPLMLLGVILLILSVQFFSMGLIGELITYNNKKRIDDYVIKDEV